MGAEAGLGAWLNILGAQGVNISAQDAERLQQKILSGSRQAIDPAVINQRRYMDTLMSDFGANVRKVNPKTYMEYLDAGGAGVGISAEAAKAAGDPKLAGRAITYDTLKGGGAAATAAEQTLAGMTSLDLARNTELSARMTMQGLQQVSIENWGDMYPWLAAALNSGTPGMGRDKTQTNKNGQ
jgi:hypothetical protein